MYKELVSESKNDNNEKIKDLVEYYLPKKGRRAFCFDGKKASTTKTLIQVMNQKDITIVEKDPSTRESIKNQFPRVEILDGYLSEHTQLLTDKNIFYFDFMVNFRGSRLNNEYPLRDIYKTLLHSTEDTIVLGVTFSLRSAKKAYNEPSWKTISDELFAIFNTCDYSIKYSEKPLSYR